MHIYLCLGIANHGFSRVELKEGEIKKEFDDMQMNIYKEQKEKELQNLEIAKKLQVNQIDNLIHYFQCWV